MNAVLVSDRCDSVIAKPLKYRYTNMAHARISGADRREQMRKDQFRFRFNGRTTALEKSTVLQSTLT